MVRCIAITSIAAQVMSESEPAAGRSDGRGTAGRIRGRKTSWSPTQLLKFGSDYHAEQVGLGMAVRTVMAAQQGKQHGQSIPR